MMKCEGERKSRKGEDIWELVGCGWGSWKEYVFIIVA